MLFPILITQLVILMIFFPSETFCHLLAPCTEAYIIVPVNRINFETITIEEKYSLGFKRLTADY